MNKYTKEENYFLTNNFFEYSLTELSELFLKEFNKKINPNTLGKHCNEIGLKKSTRSVKNHTFSKEQDMFIFENNNLGNNRLLDMFNEKFGLELTYNQIAGRKQKLGICKKIGFSKEEDMWLKNNFGKCSSMKLYDRFRFEFRNVTDETLSKRIVFLGLREQRHHYTKEQNEWLTKNISKYTYPKLTNMFNEKFNAKVTKVSIIGQCREYLGVKRGENSFSATTLPIGSEIKKNGMIYVKVSDEPFKRTERWKAKSRIIYENEKGEIPNDNEIIFLDGDKNNLHISNLYCVSKSVRACLAREKWYKKDRNITLSAIKCAELMCALKESEE